MKNHGKIRGRCYCAVIQFELTPPTKIFSHCHCESCRRSHGSAFVSWTSVNEKQFLITAGKELVKSYESSPDIFWQFCTHCGSSIFQTTRHAPGTVYITAAALLDPLDRQPDSHVSFEEKVPWLEIHDTLPKYAEKSSSLVT